MDEKIKAEEDKLISEKNRLEKLKLEKKTQLSVENIQNEISIPPETKIPIHHIETLPVAADGYNLPTNTPIPSFNALPHLSGKQANDTLKALRDRMGLSAYSQIHPSSPLEDKPTSKIPKYFSENGEALRPVHVPQALISKFLQLASRNTQSNLETCGVLAGKLHHDEFTITCLIIPKQVATSDTCAMINEEEIISAQDSLDVMSLGWIHVN